MLIGCKNIHLLLIFKSEFNGPRNACHKYKHQDLISQSAYLILAPWRLVSWVQIIKLSSLY